MRVEGFYPFTPHIPKYLISLVLVLVSGQGLVWAQSGDTIVARVNNRQITQAELDESLTAKLILLQQQLYDLRKAALENLVLRMVIEDEAKKRGISVDELKRQLTTVKVDVAKSEVEQAYAENLAAFGSMSPDEAKERLRLDLETSARIRNYREAVSKLRENSRVSLTLAEPTLPVGRMLEGAPARGGTAPLVTIIAFSDFECFYCRESQATLLKLSETYGNRLRIIFKHLPLQIHPNAVAAARAAVCAAKQDRFWNYHDALFTADSLTTQALTGQAIRLGLSLQEFKNCVVSAESRAVVLRDISHAQQLGIDGTPSFVINGRLYRGALSFEELNGIIRTKLSQVETPRASQ